jgi:two-component system phosphate regulon sensor histidine kinase PhoR
LTRAIAELGAKQRDRVATLERERDERERILAHMSDGVALLDPSGRVEHMNHSLATLLGQPLPAAPGASFLGFARAPEFEALLRRCRSERRTVEAELKLWTPRERLVRATATPLGDDADAGVLLALHDLTEVERVNRVRQDFVANVSHELRTPLTSLRGYAETLLEGGLDDVEHREEFVRIIRDQTARLQALAEDLLALAELERPDGTLRAEPFDLLEVARAQVAAFRDRARHEGLELQIAPGAPVPVVADRARIEQVLANLLDNAMKYTDRGHVIVRAGTRDGMSWCEVEDTGAGIPEEHQSRVFERFYRVDKSRSREQGGTGLGLSIVKHIVELHDGTVSVRSEPGRGSTFRFEIPTHPLGA